uniref:Uncharacterized protein n=1 Tax=Glossina morsitans morsitans TaxID=37546 RepID=A0A1B0FIM8_GLOMM
ATIPLQSFNLDCGRRLADANATNIIATSGPAKTNVAFLRTLSAPTPSNSMGIYQQQLHHNHQPDNRSITCDTAHGKQLLQQQRQSSADAFNGALDAAATTTHHHHHHHHHHNLTNSPSKEAIAHINTAAVARNDSDIVSTADATSTMPATPMTILKIEETSAAVAAAVAAAAAAVPHLSTVSAPSELELLHLKRLRQLDNEMDHIRNTSIDQSQQLSTLMQQNHYCINNSNNNSNNNNNNSNSNSNSNNNNNNKNRNHADKNIIMTTSPSIAKRIQHITSTAKLNLTTIAPQTTTLTTTTGTTTNYLLHGNDATKKGSTSTIWTSEESILRSVGAVDEDNNSTSSSACEEASGVLSSGKSGISLDSSGIDNDHNESGIGTATPPKDISFWKSVTSTHHPQLPPHHHHHHHHHHHNHHQQTDNESVSSLETLRKIKFQKVNSTASSEDPDLLEVLSMCDETQGDDEEEQEELDDLIIEAETQNVLKSGGKKQRNKSKTQNRAVAVNDNGGQIDDYVLLDEEDEGHDEFEIVAYCDCEYTDGDASSASAGSGGVPQVPNSHNQSSLSDTNSVVLRRKYSASPIMVPRGGRAQKCRSHSLDTSSLPNAYQQHNHISSHFHPHHPHAQLARKLQHLRDRRLATDRNQLCLALRQEPFQSLMAPTHFHELPSPSSASLHSGHEILDTQELSTKSNSAPLLLKQEKRRDDFANQNVTLRYSRSQSDRYLAGE